MKLSKLGLSLLLLSGGLFAKEVDITVLGTSDVHGRVVPWDYSTDMEDWSGGYAQIATIVEEYRAKSNNLIVADIGDAIQDNGIERFNTIYEAEEKHPIFSILNYIGYDFFVPGNHEFNFGINFLDEILKTFNGKVLVSNITDSNGEKHYLPSAIVEKEGVKIGFIGSTTPLTEKFEEGTENLKGLKFESPSKEIQKEIDKLKKQGADAIVLLAHMGLPNENNIPDTGVEDIARKVTGLDVIIAGHYHKNISKKIVNGVVITEPYKYGRSISKIDLRFDVNEDKETKLLGIDSDTISVKGVVGDKKVEAIYKRFHEELRKDANIELGETFDDLVQKSKIKGVPVIYTEDTGLATLFGEAGFYFSPADVIALSIDQEHAKLDKGTIKKKDINYNYQYSGGEITVYKVTGRDLRDYLEWSAGYFNQLKKGDLLLSFDLDRRSEKYATFDFAKGVDYDIDLREPKGNRIKNLRFSDGRKINEDTSIKLGMNSYRMERMMSSGGPLKGREIKALWDSKAVYGEDEGTVRYMTMKYIKDVLKGKVDIKASNNWKIIGLPKGKDRDKAVEMINNGSLELHNQGRATNIVSVSVDDIK